MASVGGVSFCWMAAWLEARSDTWIVQRGGNQDVLLLGDDANRQDAKAQTGYVGSRAVMRRGVLDATCN